MAISNLPAKGQIRILSRTGKLERVFELKGWPHPDGVDWTADGKALLISFANPAGAMLARVDLAGHVQPLYTLAESHESYAIASPDGRYLAIAGLSFAGRNVWMLENFWASSKYAALPDSASNSRLSRNVSQGEALFRHAG